MNEAKLLELCRRIGPCRFHGRILGGVIPCQPGYAVLCQYLRENS